MSIRKFVVLAALAAFVAIAMGSVSASATTFLRTDPSGALYSGTIRNNGSDPAVWTSAFGTLTCNQTFLDADVNVASGNPSLAGTLTSLTFTSCTDTILAVNFASCTLHAGSPMPSITITGNATGGAVALSDTVIRCSTSATQACYYTFGAPMGSALNSNSSIGFSNVAMVGVLPTTDAVPVANCGSSGNFSFTLTHLVSFAGATVTVKTV